MDDTSASQDEKNEREIYQKERLSNMKLPLEIRFFEKTISIQEFARNKEQVPLPAEKFKGQTGELFFGNLKIGTAVYQEDSALKISAMHLQQVLPSGSADNSKEYFLPLINDSQFPVRILVDKGYMDLGEFSRLQKNDRIKLKRHAGEPLSVYAGDIPIAQCEITVIDDNAGCRICDIVQPAIETNYFINVLKFNEPQLPSPVIGYEVIFAEIKCSLMEIAEMKEGSILEFDKLPFEPCRLAFANGVEFLADVLIIDDFFGLKILKNLYSTELEKRTGRIHVTGSDNGNDKKKQFFPDLDDPEKTFTEFQKIAEQSPEEIAQLLGKALEMPSTIFYASEKLDMVSSSQNDLQNTPQKNAAILILLAGEEISANVLKNFSSDCLAKITPEIARIGLVAPHEKIFALSFYLQLKSGNLVYGGIEKIRKILKKSLTGHAVEEMIKNIELAREHDAFERLKNIDHTFFKPWLWLEHPQTIAMILSLLGNSAGNSNAASQLLAILPSQLQADVSRRIARMNSLSSGLVRKVAWILERKLSLYLPKRYISTGGVDSIVEMMKRVDRGSEKTIIEALEEEDPELTEEIKTRMFVFKDIVLLDDRGIQKVLQEVDREILVKAMKMADIETQKKIFRNMSTGNADRLREDINSLESVRQLDVQESQLYIMNVIRRLENEGEILVLRP